MTRLGKGEDKRVYVVHGEGIFIEELRLELGRRGIGFPRVAGMTHPLPSHDPDAEQAHLRSVLDGG